MSTPTPSALSPSENQGSPDNIDDELTKFTKDPELLARLRILIDEKQKVEAQNKQLTMDYQKNNRQYVEKAKEAFCLSNGMKLETTEDELPDKLKAVLFAPLLDPTRSSEAKMLGTMYSSYVENYKSLGQMKEELDKTKKENNKIKDDFVKLSQNMKTGIPTGKRTREEAGIPTPTDIPVNASAHEANKRAALNLPTREVLKDEWNADLEQALKRTRTPGVPSETREKFLSSEYTYLSDPRTNRNNNYY